ncbi:putative nucleoside-triphosphatase [Hylaeus volcanicus]|uniref:putative nucleoside-triphosphatase n=1 Tax=Hylaeus volcanicus TaxID=313075 RepID=UPI0023B777A0|nr:putative nucleoside-triphosphatase [Hylaeus volcanicus]XP_053990764.1 putative nucleoside-triphosphatase [Hylaeus volcanicus]
MVKILTLYRPLLMNYIFLICSNFQSLNKINSLVFSSTLFVVSQPIEKFVRPHHQSVLENPKLNILISTQTLEFVNKKNFFLKSQEYPFDVIENKTSGPLSFEDIYQISNEQLFQTIIEGQYKIRNLTLYMLLLDGGSTKTSGVLWSTTVTQKVGQILFVDWSGMKIVKNLGLTRDLRSFHKHILTLKCHDSILEATAELLQPLFKRARHEIKSIIKESFFPDSIIPNIPVIVHSTAGLRDLSATSRRDLFQAIEFVVNVGLENYDSYKNTNPVSYNCSNPSVPHLKLKKLKTCFQVDLPLQKPKKKIIRFFTTSRYCRAISGIEEAVFTFMTANIATGVIQDMAKNSSKRKDLVNILEVGGASMQVVFTVQKNTSDTKLLTLDLLEDEKFLKKDMFPSSMKDFDVFGSSYMNLGNNRALALLLKQHCQNNTTPEGKCYSPCFHKGWKQTCIPGTPRRRKDFTNSTEGSPLEMDSLGRVIMDGNYLLEVAQFCNTDDPLLNQTIPRENCIRAGFDLDKTTLEEKAQIDGCVEIEGTANVTECHKVIWDFLFSKELPGNHQARLETGTGSPLEIGQLIKPNGTLYVIGNSLNIPISKLKKWKMLESAYYNAGSGIMKRCDLTYLENASRLLCGMELDKSHKFINPVTLEPIQIDQENYDYCYRSVYALALFQSLNVKKGDVQVQFETKINHVKNGEVIDFGWSYGAITNLILNSSFILDLFTLGPQYYKAACQPPQLLFYDVFQKLLKFGNSFKVK